MSVAAEYLHPGTDLRELLRDIADVPPLEVRGICSDSRSAASGDLFLACAGESSHGLDYLQQALDAGVAAVAYDSAGRDAPAVDSDVPLIAVPGLGAQLGTIANRFYGTPSADVRVIGVTGTNGKTTVAWLLAHCLERLGEACGYIGTLGAGLGDIETGSGLTTPDTLQLHRQLAAFRDAHANYAAIEVSSHALAQRRVDGVRFDAVLFTNLGRDHLDYHGDLDSYGEAKAQLFVACESRQRIVNLDSEFGSKLADRCGPSVITVSTRFDRVANGRPFVFVRSVVADASGSQLRIQSSWGDAQIALPLPGDFNVANAVLVLALLLSLGVPIEQASALLEGVQAPPGRMQRVIGGAGRPAVYVDYAHTPDALDAALKALRPHCRGRLWCVFGCGGDRDRGKRPQMGGIAERRADRLVLTSDNPRSEPPQAILAEISAGLKRPAAATVIEDRATAIGWAIGQASAGDVVLLAGKGHESYQQLADRRIPFSDYGVASVLLAESGPAI